MQDEHITSSEDVQVDSNQPFLKNIYGFRCIDAAAQESQRSGNKMIRLDWEVISPETARTVNGLFHIVGMQCTNYLMLEGAGLPQAKKFVKKMGMTMPEFDNFDKSTFIGITIKNIGQSRLKEQLGQEIDEETGEVKTIKLTDGEGKVLSRWQFEMASLGDDAVRRFEGDAPAF